MGCDIHTFVEKYEVNTRGHKEWRSVDYWVKNKYYEPDNNENEPEFRVRNFYDGRNYDLFGALANVRRDITNGLLPKGMPDNASIDIKNVCREWGVDGHSHSYLTLAELKVLKKRTGSCLTGFQKDLRKFIASRFYEFEVDNMKDEDVRVIFWFDN